MMVKSLLSIDWDYFIYTQKGNWGSFMENRKNVIDLWYKRYIQSKTGGRDIKRSFMLSSDVDTFWNKIKKIFKFEKDIKSYVSDSHALSYNIAEDNNCSEVYLFDAHSDLGYGGLSSLNFEVNCANWLGKLLKSGQVKAANIIYSPYTQEKPEYFKAINNAYNVRYISLSDLKSEISIETIHICRSGAWTPPWFDDKFNDFINEPGLPNKIIDCPKRKWDTEHISFSDKIYYMMA